MVTAESEHGQKFSNIAQIPKCVENGYICERIKTNGRNVVRGGKSISKKFVSDDKCKETM
jgi:hypothetical protein